MRPILARFSVVVAILLLVSNPGVQAQLDPFDPSPRQTRNTIPANILALNGKKVEIYGNILPLDYDSSGTSTFILNASVDACGFGGVPRINEWVYVAMKPGQKAKTYGAGYEILVRGTFSIAEEVEKGRHEAF